LKRPPLIKNDDISINEGIIIINAMAIGIIFVFKKNAMQKNKHPITIDNNTIFCETLDEVYLSKKYRIQGNVLIHILSMKNNMFCLLKSCRVFIQYSYINNKI
jgi:hypothetical protein